MESLDKKIKESYNLKTLSPEQLESIQNASVKENKKRNSTSYVLKYAAAFLILLTSFYSLYILPSQKQNTILNEFTTEIAFNHQKKLPSEIETTSISELNTKLHKLNFKITLPERITDSYQLIGGRYCSVDNRIAAQLKLKNKDSEIITCYVFKKIEAFDFDTKKTSENTEVSLWNSNTLIYAIARDKKK